jgi:hypothetical protein
MSAHTITYAVLLSVLLLRPPIWSAAERLQGEATARQADPGETARLLEQQAGGSWRKSSRGWPLFCQVMGKDEVGRGTAGVYAVLPYMLDDAGKARAFVFANHNAVPFDVLGCNDVLTVMASYPRMTPEFTAKIRAALRLRDPGFRIDPRRSSRSHQPGVRTHGIATHLDRMQLELLYYGESGSPRFAVTLSVPELTAASTAEWQRVRVNKREAQKIVDATDAAGLFGPLSAYLAGQRPRGVQRFALVMRGYLRGVDQYADDLAARDAESRARILRVLRSSLSGQAARAMDELLARIGEAT